MRTLANLGPHPWLLGAIVIVASACAPLDSAESVDVPTGALIDKGGLDGPAVPVGPFLDGAFPSTTPSTELTGDWSTEVMFQSLNLGNIIAISANPADDRLYASTLEGLVRAFDNDPNVNTTDTFIDLRDRVALVFEGGLLGLVFHPDFGQPGSPHRNSFYVYYSSHCPLDASRDAPNLAACDDSYPRNPANGFYDVWLRLSRFEVFDGTFTGDPSSEQVLFNVRLENGLHRGGGLGIRDNGELFVSIGDQGLRAESQMIDDNFNGSVLRVAVNVIDNGDGTWSCPLGSHQPRRIFDTTDEISGRYYCIPDDNGWIDPTGQVFEEYCAIGFRNPFRLGVDPANGRVWVGDVGEVSREEIDVVECGNNYGWPFREGTIAGVSAPPATILGVVTDPVVDFTRSEAASIVGGYVYRGTRFPDLVGRYITGDFVTKRIYAIDLDEATLTGTKTYLTNFAGNNLASWGQDNDGELYIGSVYSTGRIQVLDRDGVPTPDAPALLSQTGAFADIAAATPSDVFVPYGLNQPFWSDGAVKTRFLALPNDGNRDTASEKVTFSESGDWDFPIGTVLMKHFELPLNESFPSLRRRLETRFFVLGNDSVWYGVTYRWRADGSDADLLTTGATEDFMITLAGGGTRSQTWHFPSRSECITCHRDASGGALGPSTHQLNGDFTYPATGRTDNQLVTWNDLGMFSPTLSNAAVPSYESAPALEDVTAPLQDRARSWLDANCGYCHRPGGVNAGFDARYTTPFDQQGFVGTSVNDDLGVPGMVVLLPGDPSRSALLQRAGAVGSAAMPPLAKELPEIPAVLLLTEWVERLPASPSNGAPSLSRPPDQDNEAGNFVSLQLDATDPDGDLLYYDAVNLPDGLSLNSDSGLIFGNLTSSGTWFVTVSASDGPTVSSRSFVWSIISTCADGGAPPCDGGQMDCRAGRGAAPVDPLVALILLMFGWSRRRRTAHRAGT